MSNKLQPISNTDFYLQAMLNVLLEIKNGLVDVENELATLNKTLQAQSKPVIKIDATELANRLETLVKATNATANNQANEALQQIKKSNKP